MDARDVFFSFSRTGFSPVSLSLIESVVGLKEVEGLVEISRDNVETVLGGVCCRCFACVIVTGIVERGAFEKANLVISV